MSLDQSKFGPIIVIGGANVDIQGVPESEFRLHDSNLGFIRTTLGGVGRNIAENGALLGLDIQLITAIGKDSDGDQIVRNAMERGISLDYLLESFSHRTSTYLYILDDQGELCVAINDMGIVESLDERFFEPLIDTLNEASYVVLDANLSQSTIEYLGSKLTKSNIVFDAVSSVKALRAKAILGNLSILKTNIHEAQSLTGIQLDDKASISNAGKWLVDQGVEELVITLGQEGVYYRSSTTEFFMQAPHVDVVNATGAGDSFTAALVYGLINGMDKETLMTFCMGAAEVTLKSPLTISTEMSVEAIEGLR